MNEVKKNTRRRYSAELKKLILAECTQPDASVAGVALSHGINAGHPHRAASRRHQCVVDLAASRSRAVRPLD